MSTTPPEPAFGAPSREAELRQELQSVRLQALEELESGDAVTGREYLGAVVGGLGIPLGLIMVGAGFSAFDHPDSAVLLIVVGSLLLAAAYFGLRGAVRRRVAMVRAVRALRRRERALIAQLPKGSTRPGLWNQYYTRRFGSPYIAAALFVSGLFLTIAVVYGD